MSTERFELIAPCHFGLEAVLKREILDLGYEISKVEDGKVTFLADAQGIADANVFLRTTERILLKVAEVKEVMDDAIRHSQKASAKKLMRKVFGRNTDESDRIILSEKDFNI